MKLLFIFLIVFTTIFASNRVRENKDKINFTKEELSYIKTKKVINICVLPNSHPYSAVEDGKYIGIGSQVLDLSKKYVNFKYHLVDTLSWQKSLQKGVNATCDLFPIASKSKGKEYLFNFTTPYHCEPLVITTKKDKQYILNFQTLLDKEFSIVKGLSFIRELKLKYPTIKLNLVDSTKDGLIGVEDGKYYGHIDVLISSAYYIKKLNTSKLQISGQFDDKVKVSFGVRKDDLILFSIFEKIANKITPSDLDKLLNKWVIIDYKQQQNYMYIKELIAVVFFIVLIFVFRQQILNKKNKELKKLQNELIELNSNLESKIKLATYDLEQVQEVAKIGFWIYDIEKDKLRWSDYTYKLFEVTPSKNENLYETLFNLTHPDDREKVKDAYYGSLETKSIYAVEHRIVMSDGRIKYISERGETRFYPDSTPKITYGTSQDITQIVLAGIELKKKDTFLLHQSRLAQMGEMLSMIAHQWKQPLSAISSTQIIIKTTLELEKYDLSNSQEREVFLEFLQERLDKIGFYVQNLSNTITDFSDYYKPNKLPKHISLDHIIRKAYEIIKDSLAANMIDVNFDLNAENKLYIYENEFMQVVLNIIQNAKEQLIQKDILNPKIDLTSYIDDEYIVVEIEDNAGGIKAEIIDHVFDPYFSTKLEKNGTGLGLYMCKMIIGEYHNGVIVAKNTKDGVKFTIKLKQDKDK